MKNLLLLLILGLNFTLIGQKPSNQLLTQSLKKWVFFQGGNPIDGFIREAFRVNDEAYDNNMYMLKVECSASKLKIENSSGEGENDRDNVHVLMRSNNLAKNLDKALMYFDNEKSYYTVNYRTFGSDDFWIRSAIGNSGEFLSVFNFIDKLRKKSTVYFRFYYLNGEQINISFPLNGSSEVIDKVVDFSNIELEDDWYIDMFIGISSLSNFLNSPEFKKEFGSLNIENFRTLLYNYIEDNFGDYGFTFLWDYSLNNEFKKLEISDMNNKVKARIPYNYFYGYVEKDDKTNIEENNKQFDSSLPFKNYLYKAKITTANFEKNRPSLRSTPNLTGEIIYSISKGDKIYVLDDKLKESTAYAYVYINGYYGYVFKDYLIDSH